MKTFVQVNHLDKHKGSEYWADSVFHRTCDPTQRFSPASETHTRSPFKLKRYETTLNIEGAERPPSYTPRD
jgi:hypothetical protein